MKKLMMTLALTACVSAMQASEKADTTVIENAMKVTIIADDSTQTIQVKGIDYRPVTIDIMGILHWSKVGVYSSKAVSSGAPLLSLSACPCRT